MPFKIVKKGNKFVIKKNYPGKGGKKVVGTSSNKNDALASIRARFAAESKVAKK